MNDDSQPQTSAEQDRANTRLALMEQYGRVQQDLSEYLLADQRLADQEAEIARQRAELAGHIDTTFAERTRLEALMLNRSVTTTRKAQTSAAPGASGRRRGRPPATPTPTP